MRVPCLADALNDLHSMTGLDVSKVYASDVVNACTAGPRQQHKHILVTLGGLLRLRGVAKSFLGAIQCSVGQGDAP